MTESTPCEKCVRCGGDVPPGKVHVLIPDQVDKKGNAFRNCCFAIDAAVIA